MERSQPKKQVRSHRFISFVAGLGVFLYGYHASALENSPASFAYNIEGTFEALCALGGDGKSEMHYAVQTDQGKRYHLHFAEPPHKVPQTGDRVKIPFAMVLPALSGDPHLMIPAGENGGLVQVGVTLPWPTTGVFRTLAILVNFQDQPSNQPWTPAAIKATIGNDVSGFDYENSFHKTTLAVDVAGWFTMPLLSTGGCDTQGIQLNGISLAAAAGFNVNSYDRLVFIFPKLASCVWVGLGYVGGGKTWGIAWINNAPTLQVIAHEMGHNFGLQHAHSRTCVGGPLGSNCTVVEYGDPAEIMGNKAAAHFSAAQKESIGWLDNTGFPGITTVQSSGVYTLEPYETFSMNAKAIRIPKATPVGSKSEYYYLEYRQPIGYDSVLKNVGNLTKGLLLHDAFAGGTGNNSYILNMSPYDPSLRMAAITPNNPFIDPNAPGGGVTVSVTSLTPERATLLVNFGGFNPPREVKGSLKH